MQRHHKTTFNSNKSPAKVLIVDDHPMMRRGLADLLDFETDINVVSEAENGQQAIDYLKENEVDLVILDHNMPVMTGIETLAEIRRRDIDVRVLLFTVSDSGGDVKKALELGADGYLLKDMEPEKIIIDMRKILNGELVISPCLAPILAQAMHKPQKSDIISNLTNREREVVAMIAEGMSNKMIGNTLNITEATVKVHVKNILQKTELRSRVEVAVWAVNQVDL